MQDSSDRIEYAEDARPVIEAGNVFARARDLMMARGYAGDGRHVQLLYAIVTSRLLQRPMCAFIKAPSSSGKSWLLNRMLELFPDEAYELKSGITPKAIAYGTSDLRHRALVIQEASGLQGKEGNLLVRTLISEGQIRWEAAAVAGKRIRTREVVRPGPIAFVMTTTHERLHREDETRALSIELEDDREHTQRVLGSIAGRYAGTDSPAEVDVAPWHAYQRWLAMGPRQATIPFAAKLAARYLANDNRSKRDFEQVLTAIAVSALMHQARRERDEQGRIVATLDDYAMVRDFMAKVVGEAAEASVPADVRETVRAILDLAREATEPGGLVTWPMLIDLAGKLGCGKSWASKRLAKAKTLGYVADRRARPGFPSRLAVIQPLPQDREVLPPVEALAAGASAGGATREAAAAPPASQPAVDDPLSAVASLGATPAPPLPPIVANAPDPDHPDGGYRARRPIYQFRAAVAEMRKQGGD